MIKKFSIFIQLDNKEKRASFYELENFDFI